MSDLLGISDRRAALVASIQAALTAAAIDDVPVCDDEPNVLSAARSIVVTWVSTSRDKVQWTHTYEVLCITTNRDAPTFFAGRDELVAVVLAKVLTDSGYGRTPSATTRTVTIGQGDRAQEYPLCGVVTVTATASPTSQ